MMVVVVEGAEAAGKLQARGAPGPLARIRDVIARLQCCDFVKRLCAARTLTVYFGFLND
jgi:hypothetical protein